MPLRHSLLSLAVAFRENREFIEERAKPAEGTSVLTFETSFSQPLWRQYCYLLAKNSILYWSDRPPLRLRSFLSCAKSAYGTSLLPIAVRC